MKAKKKTAKKVAKKATKKVAKKNQTSFSEWWDKVASPKVSKIEKAWVRDNEPNRADEEEGGDHWYVNQMMHDGEAHEFTHEIAERVWEATKKGEPWEMNQGDSLYCELDDIIMDAHEAAKKSK